MDNQVQLFSTNKEFTTSNHTVRSDKSPALPLLFTKVPFFAKPNAFSLGDATIGDVRSRGPCATRNHYRNKSG